MSTAHGRRRTAAKSRGVSVSPIVNMTTPSRYGTHDACDVNVDGLLYPHNPAMTTTIGSTVTAIMAARRCAGVSTASAPLVEWVVAESVVTESVVAGVGCCSFVTFVRVEAGTDSSWRCSRSGSSRTGDARWEGREKRCRRGPLRASWLRRGRSHA